MQIHKYTIGITGHRDLSSDQYEENLIILKGHLLKRKREYPKLDILTPLAEGADRLIAKVAIELNIPFHTILPMPKELYIKDFSQPSCKEFEAYLKHAQTIQTIPPYQNNPLSMIATSSLQRDLQYRQVGRTIVNLSDEIIIMSDEKENGKTGGTHDITDYAKKHDKILYTILCKRQCA